jgi:hypothetical protein
MRASIINTHPQYLQNNLTGYTSKTVYELKNVLKRNGLSVAGSKQDLIRTLATFEQSGVANRIDPLTPPPNGYWTTIDERKN